MTEWLEPIVIGLFLGFLFSVGVFAFREYWTGKPWTFLSWHRRILLGVSERGWRRSLLILAVSLVSGALVFCAFFVLIFWDRRSGWSEFFVRTIGLLFGLYQVLEVLAPGSGFAPQRRLVALFGGTYLARLVVRLLFLVAAVQFFSISLGNAMFAGFPLHD